MRKRNRAVSAVILALTVAAVFSPFALVAEAAPDSTLAPITAKEVDVKKLSRDIFDEVNKLREKPSAAADVMTKMRDSAKPAPPNGLAITFPDASATHGDSRDFATLLYLNSAIATARNTAPMGTLTWSDELASAAQKYAEKNPSGHNAFNSTPASRIAEVGSHRGMAESIDYVGYTGVLATYRLFIDSNVPSLGHRTMMIKPEFTHLGVGCSYIKQTDRVTCVLKYATDFVPKADEPKFEVGKQYVVPVLGGSFQFFKVRSINRNGIQLDLCPDLRASMTISGPAGVTTVNNARRLGLTTTNEPCDESSVPPGVMNNGTQLPKSVPATSAPATKTPSAPASTAPAATAAPSAAPPATPAPLPGATTPAPNQPANTSTPVDDGSGPALKLEMGKVYAIREDPASKNVRYFKLLTFRGSARVAEREYTFLVCSDLNGTLTVWGTPTSLNATVFEPSEVKSRGFTATNEPCTTTRGKVSLTMGAQYAYREAGNTFRYVKIMRTRGGHQSVSLSVCPNANPNAMTTMSFGSIDQASQQILRVEDALGDDLVPTNQACDATKTPFGR